MRSGARLLILSLLGLSVGLAAGCKDEPKDERRHEPMRKPAGQAGKAPAKGGTGDPLALVPTEGEQAERSAETGQAPALGEPPKPDPAIERTLELISTSGRQFATSPEVDDKANGKGKGKGKGKGSEDEEVEERPPEYTAEQFASMLRSKWEWVGYDIVDHEVWLDEIATRSFKTNLPYLVVLEDGRRTELRPWLDAQLAAQAKADADAEKDKERRK